MKRIIAIMLLLLLLLTGCAKPETAPEAEGPVAAEPVVEPEPEQERPAENLFVFSRETLPVLDGSTSMVPLGQAVAAVLLGESREQVSDLVDFHRTTESFRYLMRGESDLLLVAEPNQVVFDEMEQQNFAYEMQPIAKEALVFIVNSDNPIDSLTVEQLQGIYTGQITNWSQVGGDDVEIVAFQRNATSGSQVLMDKLVMGDLEMMEAPQEWVPGEMETLMAGVKGYEDSAAAIGYSVYYYAEDMRMAEGMKIISVEGVEPTDETIGTDEYPLINPYFAVIGAEAAADSPTRILYDWLVSSDGQMVLESQGYVPVETTAGGESTVYMDSSGLSEYEQPQEIFTRANEEWTEELLPGNYGMLRPYVGSRAAFDMTIYGGSGIYDGYMGLVDETGAIVVDPVYTDVSVLYDWNSEQALPFYRLSKETWIDSEWGGGYMGQVYGFCSLDGSVVQPCTYELVTCTNGYIVALERAEDGLFQIFDSSGELLLDSADWPQRPQIYTEMGAGTIDVSENLLFITVVTDPDNWEIVRWLYDWEGNVLSTEYDWVELYGDAPYAYGSWDGGSSGYIDAYGQPVLENAYDSVSAFRDGQALVTIGGVCQVIDVEGNTLWIPPEGEVYYEQSGGCGYYSWREDWDSACDLHYYDLNFKRLYPEVDYIQHVYGDCFLLWQGDSCTITNGKVSAEVPGAENPDNNYHGGAESGLILINSWKDGVYTYWLFDSSLQLLRNETLTDESVELLSDQLSGDAVVVQYPSYSYPYQYTVLDYPGAPKLEGVNVLGIYGGWYLVEDEFTAGYMDADGNWLFRVSLMADMTD